MSARVPATIITGFLGAGKTTLVRHLLQNAGGRRIAVIVNEFGSLGIDGALLAGCGIEGCDEDSIVELSNGCLCCTVADEFLPAMEALMDRPNPPEHIVIETSGLALPKPLLKAFSWPAIRTRVTVDGVIAVIDGPAVAAGRFADDPEEVARQMAADPSLDHDNPLAEVYEDQLNAADLVLLNKTDLMDEAELAQRSGGGRRCFAACGEGRPDARRSRRHRGAVGFRRPRPRMISPPGPRIMTRSMARTSMMIGRVSSSMWASSRRPSRWSRVCGRRRRRMTCCG